jgi:hypothetical protein
MKVSKRSVPAPKEAVAHAKLYARAQPAEKIAMSEIWFLTGASTASSGAIPARAARI